MSLLRPDSEEATIASEGEVEEALPVYAPVIVSNASAPVTSAGTKTNRRQRAPDYRLRGLDLGAQSVAEPPPRAVRKEQPNRRRRHRLLVEWAVALTVIALIGVLMRAFVVQPYSVAAPSMLPTLQVGDRILAVNVAIWPAAIGKGDIVVFHHPRRFDCRSDGGAAQDLVERVIGLPGQTIRSAGDTIYVNGRILHEPGWYNPPYGQLGSTPIRQRVIPRGDYFVMADNRVDSCDSRAFGPIPGSLIVGMVIAIVMRDGHPHVHLF
jgi:signal peptidase I